MEPERNIEKILRSFAKKRREQAGPPLELHSAKRRQLQEEVARRERAAPVNALVAEIDAERLEADRPPNLTSAIRQWLFARRLAGE